MKSLLAIDIQTGILDMGIYNKDLLIKTVNEAIELYRTKGYKIIHIRHTNDEEYSVDSDFWKVDDTVNQSKDDLYFNKYRSDSFSNEELISYINNNNITDILACGLRTEGCVRNTCIGGMKHKYNMSLLYEGHSELLRHDESLMQKTEDELRELGVDIICIDRIKRSL